MKTTLKRKLDKLWSATIRNRDGKCMRHIGSHPSQLNAHHVVFRSKGDILRWDVLNGISLCGIPCHRWNDNSAHTNNGEFNEWFATNYLDRWVYLQKQKNKTIQFKDYHYELIENCIIENHPISTIEDML
jgi:hypothetical protein